MKISIIALGKLGTLLYKKLAPRYNVMGSFYSIKKGVSNEFFFDFNDEIIPNELDDLDILIFNLTPSVINSIKKFKNFIDKTSPKRFIFISSTSVYGEQGHVDEDSPTIPQSESGKLLKLCEDYLIQSSSNYLIIRPGGIVYHNSHPAKYLSGKNINMFKGERVNLIQVDDLVDIVANNLLSSYKIINAVNINHPLKIEYYTNYCLLNNLDIPNFIEFEKEKLKVVDTKYKKLKVFGDLP